MKYANGVFTVLIVWLISITIYYFIFKSLSGPLVGGLFIGVMGSNLFRIYKTEKNNSR